MKGFYPPLPLRRLQTKLGIRSFRPKPHFLGIGTQKGGTSTLYWVLRNHPEIFLPEPKELQYFTLNSKEPVDWYSAFFSEAKAGQLRAEITPYYVYHPAVPERIYHLNPSMRMILLLRDPVERALSQYFHAKRKGFEELSIEKAFSAEASRLAGSMEVVMRLGGVDYSHQKHSYVSRSRYDQQIMRYLNYFKPVQLLILRSEDLFEQPNLALDKIKKFLDISPFPAVNELVCANQGEGEAVGVSRSLRKQLRLKLLSTYNWLENELGLTWPQA